jgi:hypothetical protein
MPENTLYYGDNLDILRRCFCDETVGVPASPPSRTIAEHHGTKATRQGCVPRCEWSAAREPSQNT